LGIGFLASLALAFLALQPFSGCLPMQGLSGFDLPPSGKVLLKSNFSKTPDVSARRSRAFFTSLNLPLLLQASGKMDRQWLCSLNPVLS
jgi:hypothetical protein